MGGHLLGALQYAQVGTYTNGSVRASQSTPTCGQQLGQDVSNSGDQVRVSRSFADVREALDGIATDLKSVR